MRPPGAQIVDPRRVSIPGSQSVQGPNVRVGDVRDVHVVALAGAVRGRIVVPEHLQRRSPAGRVEGARDQVNLRVVVLAEVSVRVRPGRVEVAQRDRPKAVGAPVVAQGMLDRQLRVPVRVDGVGGVLLADGRRHRVAVHGAGRRQHQPIHPARAHRVQHRERPPHVVLVVPGRIAHRLLHRQEGREVHHLGDPVVTQRRLEPRGLADVSLHERRAAHRRAVPGAQIVVHHDRAPCRLQGLHGMAADVSGAARHQHRTHLASPQPPRGRLGARGESPPGIRPARHPPRLRRSAVLRCSAVTSICSLVTPCRMGA